MNDQRYIVTEVYFLIEVQILYIEVQKRYAFRKVAALLKNCVLDYQLKVMVKPNQYMYIYIYICGFIILCDVVKTLFKVGCLRIRVND